VSPKSLKTERKKKKVQRWVAWGLYTTPRYQESRLLSLALPSLACGFLLMIQNTYLSPALTSTFHPVWRRKRKKVYSCLKMITLESPLSEFRLIDTQVWGWKTICSKWLVPLRILLPRKGETVICRQLAIFATPRLLKLNDSSPSLTWQQFLSVKSEVLRLFTIHLSYFSCLLAYRALRILSVFLTPPQYPPCPPWHPQQHIAFCSTLLWHCSCIPPSCCCHAIILGSQRLFYSSLCSQCLHFGVQNWHCTHEWDSECPC
jgi:hypothetical protein